MHREPKPKLLKWTKRKRFWVGLFLLQIVSFYILSKTEWAVRWFGIFFDIRKNLGQNTLGQLSFSLGDYAYAGIGLYWVYFIVKMLRSPTRTRSAVQFLAILNGAYFVYQCFWGMMYFQPPLSQRLPQEPIRVEEIKALAVRYLHLARQARREVAQDEKGIFRIKDKTKAFQTIFAQQSTLPKEIQYRTPLLHRNFKSSEFSFLLNKVGVLGYYNPFTTEAQFNEFLPDTYLLFTVSHEMAHQIGYAREQEASFIAFLLGKNADSAEIRYSTAFYTLKSLLNALPPSETMFVEQVLVQYSPEMKRDRQYEKDFAQKHRGTAQEIFGYANDLFLKSNQQEGSVTYSYFVELLIRYERTQEKPLYPIN